MKIDPEFLKFISKDEIRVLLGIEMGMRNHEWVSVPLVESISKIKRGKTQAIIQKLARQNLLNHNSKIYDGYNLRKRGQDYLALYTLSKKLHCLDIGTQMGCGKESDIHVAQLGNVTMNNHLKETNFREIVVKFTRLGRTCFRQVKNKRDYLDGRHDFSNWLYLSRLSAQREHSQMEILQKQGFPLPSPIAMNRHCILMERVHGDNLQNCKHRLDSTQAANVLTQCLEILLRMRNAGLVHGDQNEFNIMVEFPPLPQFQEFFSSEVGEEDAIAYKRSINRYQTNMNDKVGYIPKELFYKQPRVLMIDFPQMVSFFHEKAFEQQQRDLESVISFFKKHWDVDPSPELFDLCNVWCVDDEKRIDKEVLAQGCNKDQDEDEEEAIEDDQEEEENDEEFNLEENDGLNKEENIDDNQDSEFQNTKENYMVNENIIENVNENVDESVDLKLDSSIYEGEDDNDSKLEQQKGLDKRKFDKEARIDMFKCISESVKSLSKEIDYFAIRDNLKREQNNKHSKENQKSYNKKNRRANKNDGKKLKCGVDFDFD